MNDDLYSELLDSLNSNDAPPKIKATVTTSYLGERKLKMEFHGPLFKDSYTGEEVQALTGFLVSMIASVLLSCSLTRAALFAEGSVLSDRVQEYLKQCQEQGHQVPDTTEELLTAFTSALKQAMETVGQTHMNEAGIDALREPVSVRSMLATATTCFMAGINPAFFMPEGDTLDARANLMVTAMDAAFGETKLIRDEKLREALLGIAKELLADGMVDKIEAGQITTEDFIQRTKDLIDGQEDD